MSTLHNMCVPPKLQREPSLYSSEHIATIIKLSQEVRDTSVCKLCVCVRVCVCVCGVVGEV